MRIPRLGVVASALTLLACAGAMPGAAPSAAAPVWPAEPVALVDLPGEERPTDVALLAEGAFATTFTLIERDESGRARASGGVRFRGLDGGPGLLADLEPEWDQSADALVLSPDGARIAVVRYDRLDVIPLDGGEVRSLPLRDPPDKGGVRSACTSARQVVWGDGAIAVRCTIGPPLVLLDPETGARTLPLAHSDPDGAEVIVQDLALSPDGRTLAVLGSSHDYVAAPHHWVELRSLADGALVRRLALGGAYEDVALAPDGARIAVSHPYFGLQILDATDGRVLAEDRYTPDKSDRGSGDVLWVGDKLYRVGRRLGVAVHDGTDARVLGNLPAHPTEPENPMPPPADWPAALAARNGTLALTSDGRFLASIERTDYGRAVRIWRLPGG